MIYFSIQTIFSEFRSLVRFYDRWWILYRKQMRLLNEVFTLCKTYNHIQDSHLFTIKFPPVEVPFGRQITTQMLSLFIFINESWWNTFIICQRHFYMHISLIYYIPFELIINNKKYSNFTVTYIWLIFIMPFSVPIAFCSWIFRIEN